MAYFPHGIFRITAVAPPVSVANPMANVDAAIVQIDQSDADLIVLPELGISGYTCGDLFANQSLLNGSLEALSTLTAHSKRHQSLIIIGLPLAVETALMNVAAVISRGNVIGMVPKTFLPNYREFYEQRHFQAARLTDPESIVVNGADVPFGTDLLFRWGEAIIGVEICEDLWTPIQPSARAALAGANVLCNLSASNETIGKAAWRRDLVRSQSGRCIAAYAYASAGPGESTSDLVFGGHCMIAENGVILDESRRVGDGQEPTNFVRTAVTCDVDLAKLAHDRHVVGSFDDGREDLLHDYRVIDAAPTDKKSRGQRKSLCRYVDAHPFVPSESAELDARCAEIFAIQTAGLTKRLSRLPDNMVCSIGISGGLDSTLALLVAARAMDALDRPRAKILGITMPGFGTTAKTKSNADELIAAMKITGESIDIRQLCLETFLSIDHQPLGIAIDQGTTPEQLQEQLQDVADDASDLTFENVQARVRTMLLMSRGFVIGTGDMSEQALGWCTYNADHMSMYNVNTSIPKTLVRFLVRYAADHYHTGKVTKLLHEIAGTTISPELLPPAADGSIRQSTEASIGNYELHDFFLYHFVRNGFDREKILYLAGHAKFSEKYTKKELAKTLEVFIRRFFNNQFKRNCVPDGPKVGSVSLSPRGDWRMPSDADSDQF